MPRYTVTSALPYANGPIHFGHVAGAYLPADIYVRTLRMLGEDVLFVCGTDEHGVAITISAEKEGTPYPEYVARWRDEIHRTFQSLGIEFDVWSGTSTCPDHAAASQEFFRELDRNGYLVSRDTNQLYCEHDGMFLADRYVLGKCYSCGHPDARGDECPSCGTWIEPLKLESPRCKICGNEPVTRTTTHWYLDLPKLRDEHLGEWIREHDWKPNVAAFIKNMLADVPERAITRDMNWGVPLPEEVAGSEGKVLYVWFDAPIGYISFTKELMSQRGTPDEWVQWWKGDTRLVHFIGKDNIPFHCLVFPSMLHGVRDGYVLPAEVPANEFYNLKGGKFSTSGGNAFDVIDFVAGGTKAQPNAAYAGSVPYLMLAGNLVAGWQLARALIAAEDALETDKDFMSAKITTARFYAEHILPRTASLRAAIVDGADSVTELSLEAF